MSVVRGRPPGLAGGMSGSNSRNWSSVSAWPDPKSPTSARSAGVHMAVSRQETACNAATGAAISPSNQAGHPFQTGCEGGKAFKAHIAATDRPLIALFEHER